MEKLAASLGSKMTGSSPETLNKIPGMEVVIVVVIFFIIIIFIIDIATITIYLARRSSKSSSLPS